MQFRWGILALVALACGSAKAQDQKSVLETDPKGWVDLLDKDLKNWNRVSIPPKSKLKEKSPWSVTEDGKTLICDGIGYHEMLLFQTSPTASFTSNGASRCPTRKATTAACMSAILQMAPSGIRRKWAIAWASYLARP